MRFLIVSLFVGLALGSPIGQVADEQVTTSAPDLLRSDILADATTVVVEIFSDDAAVTSATQRARQAPAAGGEDEDGSDEDEPEATTVASSGSGSASSAGRIRPPPAIPQPLANSSDFLAEYQFSSQFNLGPKEALPLAGGIAAAPVSANNPVPAVVGSQEPQAQQPVAQVAETPVAPNLPPAVPPSNPQPLSNSNAPQPTATIVAAGEDEDVESDEDTPTEAPSARQQQQAEAQRVEESDSDNEITNDDVTTVKSFASEYEYTVQQLGGEKRPGETINAEIPTTLLSARENRPASEYEYGGLHADNLDSEMSILRDGDGRAACECGKLPFRVPIGEEAEINLRPWTVAIVRGGLIAGGRPHCAGVLINDRYVLTSASCMEGLHPNGIQVWLTAHSTLNNHHLNVGTSKLNVQEIIVHPNYRRGYKDNDIALVKMTQPVDITTSSSYFTPVCLLSVSKFDYGGRYGQIFGWGQGRINRICAAEVPILDNDVCRRDTRHGNSITENMMCAGFLTPPGPVRTTDCIGDAGSPLTVFINGRTSLIGITSWGFEYHNRGHTPAVFTRVSLYAEWILHNTEDADWCSA